MLQLEDGQYSWHMAYCLHHVYIRARGSGGGIDDVWKKNAVQQQEDIVGVKGEKSYMDMFDFLFFKGTDHLKKKSLN